VDRWATRLPAGKSYSRKREMPGIRLGVVSRHPHTEHVVDDEQRHDEDGGEERVGYREVETPAPGERCEAGEKGRPPLRK
jgi:hypothetical protein